MQDSFKTKDSGSYSKQGMSYTQTFNSKKNSYQNTMTPIKGPGPKSSALKKR
jgi:hypothetical protein